MGETLLNEARAWGRIARTTGIEPHVMWAAMGVVIERRETHRRVYELLGIEPPPGPVVGWEDRDFYPDARACLTRLREAGYFVGAAGNIGWDIEPFFVDCGLELDLVATSFTLGVEKPSPEFFARLVERAGAAPEETAYVGDRVDNDVVPAADAGMVAVHIRRGPWGYLQSGSERADLRIRSLDELPDMFIDV